MPNLTTNYNLKKPLGSEPALIEVLNENADKIDSALSPSVSDETSPTETTVAQNTKLGVILGWIANRIKAITGKTHWYDVPSTTLEAASAHIKTGKHNEASALASGFMPSSDKIKLDGATSQNTVGTLVMRDEYGRAKVSAPIANSDAVNKAYVDDKCTAKALKGTYIGTGEKYRFISLGFTPDRVSVTCEQR